MSVYGRVEEVHKENREPLEYQIEQESHHRESSRLPLVKILLWSTLVTGITLGVPLLLDLMSAQEVQDFYAGWGLHQTGKIYSDYYGSQGLLYYLLTYVSQGGFFFAIFEWLALVAGGFFFAPLSSLLFIAVVSLGLLVFNLGHRRFAHGFYQFLAVALGFSLVFYPTAYYSAATGSFGDAISGIRYPIDSIRFDFTSKILENMFFYGLLSLGLGFVVCIFLGLFQSKPFKLYVISVPASLVVILGLILLFFSQEPLHASYLMVVFPVFLLLLVTNIKSQQRGRSARRSRRETPVSLWSRFFKGNLYLLVFGFVYLLSVPFLMKFVLYPVPYQERNRLADLVKEETNTEDAIYAWDDTATLYRKSERLSPSAILSPLHYTATEENRNKLLNDLKEKQPKVIVVNDKVVVWSEVETLLKENYQQVKTDYSEFKVYKIK
ncbi:TPA: damage-inducible protein CinA [Streptococcus pneumoniae]|nr:damage-inducible protein CinA [Streptococcus pneumoniae]HEV7093011.1 damage-inducible protein CinA [Streptococcus pneumoniae]